MFRKMLVAAAVAAVCAAFITAPAMAAGPSHHSPLTNVGPTDVWTNEGGNPSFNLHAHANNGALTVTSCCFQDWTFVNQENRVINGVTVPTWQIELVGDSGWCINFHTSDLLFWLNSCVDTDGQRFAFNNLGNGNDQMIPVSCSNINLVTTYVAVISNTDNSEVHCEAFASARTNWALIVS